MGTKPSACRYDLNTLGGDDLTALVSLQQDSTPEEKATIDALLSKHGLTQKRWVDDGRTYNIIRMNKEKVQPDNYADVGRFRSVIYRDGLLRCVSPPKSIPYNNAMGMNQFASGARATEFVEGTMINLFWDDGAWRISTRSSVGGRVGFFTTGTTRRPEYENTFRWMFLDAINQLEDEHPDSKKFFDMMDDVPHDVCVSCVLQHPNNRIVVPFSKPAIYVVAAYRMTNVSAEPVDIYTDEFSSMLPVWVQYPALYNYDSFSELVSRYAGPDTDYKTLGVMITSADGYLRTKVRNQAYETVRHLRGNQPKLQYRYLVLRKERKVSDYLRYYPEHKTLFAKYRRDVHSFTERLHSNYVACYVRKEKPLIEYSDELRTNMFKLHSHYIGTLREEHRIVNKAVVVEYVNTMEPSILMHAINFQANRARREAAAMQQASANADEQGNTMETE